MQKVSLLLAICFILLSSHPVSANPSIDQLEVIKIKIDGMVCEACSADLTKVFTASESVTDIKVDLSTQTLSVSTSDSTKVSDELIKKLVTENGFKLVEINRHD